MATRMMDYKIGSKYRCTKCQKTFFWGFKHGDAVLVVAQCTGCGTWQAVRAPVRGQASSVSDEEQYEPEEVYEDDLQHYCGTCQKPMQHVRPGKWQCNYCEGEAPELHIPVRDRLGSPNLNDRKQTMEWIEGAIEDLEESYQELYERTGREGQSYADSQILCFLGDRMAELMKERGWRDKMGVVDPDYLKSWGVPKPKVVGTFNQPGIAELIGIPAIVDPMLVPDETLEDSDDEERTKKWVEGAIDSYEAEFQRLAGLPYTNETHQRQMNIGDRLSELFEVRLALKKHNWTKRLFHARALLEVTRSEMRKDGINIWGDILPKLDAFLDEEDAEELMLDMSLWEAASDEALEKVDTLISVDEELGQARALLEAMCTEMVKDGYTEKRNDLLNRADAFLRGSCD